MTLEKYFSLKRKSTCEPSSLQRECKSPELERLESQSPKKTNVSSKQVFNEFELSNLPSDPSERPKITEYDPNIREDVCRAYLQRGPCQPKEHTFPFRAFGTVRRRFNSSWFKEFHWLDYSVKKDEVYCLYCYLFKEDMGSQGGGDIFVNTGFTNWKNKKRLSHHEGGPSSSHRISVSKGEDLMKQRQHIEQLITRQSDVAKANYRTRLLASIDAVSFLLEQGLAFRGHDESEDSSNPGNFLAFIKYQGKRNKEIQSVTLNNAPENLKLISPEIQKDIVSACAIETTSLIIKNLGDSPFAVLIDESRDISVKEQMSVVLRYVSKDGCVVESFLGLKHVTSTDAKTLKCALEDMLHSHGLSISNIRGQGYDGASNMQGAFRGLKALILEDNESAHYVHCFAHQLQLALVAVAKNNIQVNDFFHTLSRIVNFIGGSCKRKELLREKQAAATRFMETILDKEAPSGKGMNQEYTLARSGDTRWGSHYRSIVSLFTMYGPVIDVLQVIKESGNEADHRREAYNLLGMMESFDFAFTLLLMKSILAITDELSLALQRKDQDIENAMSLVGVTKDLLQNMRDNSWSELLDKVSSLCAKFDIFVPNMDEIYGSQGKRQRGSKVTNLHHYKVELFYTVLDLQLQELNNRFNEVNSALLCCISCLSPKNSFSQFQKEKLIELARLYPRDFSEVDIEFLSGQLDVYRGEMLTQPSFLELNGISELAQSLVATGKNIVYPLVYKLITLSLVLPIATASVERSFSAMSIIKNRLRNRIGDQWLNDIMIVYVEKDLFRTVDDETIIRRFQTMKNRRMVL